MEIEKIILAGVTVLTVAGVGFGMYSGYKDREANKAYENNTQSRPVESPAYEFSDFGYKSISNQSVTSITRGDVDGDGDQDIIIGVQGRLKGYDPITSGVIVIENKIPQKKAETRADTIK